MSTLTFPPTVTAGTEVEPPVETPARAPVRAWLDRAAARLADPSVPLALTLVLVMLSTSQRWYVAVPTVVLGTMGLAVPEVRRSPYLWLALAAALGAAAWSNRWEVDNHQFLIAYWCLAVGLAAGCATPAGAAGASGTDTDPERVRRLAARLLVGLVFLCATTWKVLSPDFVSGAFMHHTLLTDSRFSEVATLVGGLSSGELAANREALAALDDPTAPQDRVELTSTARLERAAVALTWWTLAIEGSVAVAFLAPWRRLARHRDLLLVAFVLTTYAVAPVVGFGWLLVCLGLAQHDRSRRLVPLAYVAAFLLVQVFTAPWTSLMGVAG